MWKAPCGVRVLGGGLDDGQFALCPCCPDKMFFMDIVCPGCGRVIHTRGMQNCICLRFENICAIPKMTNFPPLQPQVIQMKQSGLECNVSDQVI